MISGLAQTYFQGVRGGGLTNWVEDIQKNFLYVNMRNICSNAIFSRESAFFVPKVPICFSTWMERYLHLRFEQMIRKVQVFRHEMFIFADLETQKDVTFTYVSAGLL